MTLDPWFILWLGDEAVTVQVEGKRKIVSSTFYIFKQAYEHR